MKLFRSASVRENTSGESWFIAFLHCSRPKSESVLASLLNWEKAGRETVGEYTNTHFGRSMCE